MHPDLPLGAHLTSPRRGYQHHGLYAGNGRVIHYGGFNRLFVTEPVQEVSFETFTRGRGYAVKPWVAPTFAGAQAVERARSRLGENGYRLFTNNCEHFVEWCVGGRSRSTQVEKWVGALRRTVARLAPRRARVAQAGLASDTRA